METLSKVNEQKDNILASSETLSPSGTLKRGFMEGVRSKTQTFMNFCVFVKHLCVAELLLDAASLSVSVVKC